MANYQTQNGGQTYVAPIPIVSKDVYCTSPAVATYPPTYAVLQQQQQQPPSASFHKRSAIGLGVVLIICGAISQAGAAIALRFFAGFAELACGHWAGSMFVAAGAIGIAAGDHRTKKLITGTATTSFLAAAAAFIQILFSAWGLDLDLLEYHCIACCNPDYDPQCICYYDNWEAFAITANCMMIGAASLAFIGSMWLFIIACIALCRKSTSFQVHAIPVHLLPQVEVSNTIDPTASSQVQYWHQQHEKSSMPLNHPTSNTPFSSESSQFQESRETPKNDSHQVKQF